MKKYAEDFYKSKQWQDCRNSYMKLRQGLCEDCMKEGRITPAEEVHHIKFITPKNIHDPRITLSFDNLVCLCREHHRQRHGASQSNSRCVIDEYGRVLPKIPTGQK